MKHYISLFLLLSLTLISCSDKDDGVADAPTAEVKTLNVDVILPTNIQQQWQNTIDWALANIAKADDY